MAVVVTISFNCLPGMPELDEYTMERVIEEFEQRCYDNMNHAIETEEGLGIEYDEDVVCDVCQSPDGEDGNEMVFCDKCNICVHQVWWPGQSRGECRGDDKLFQTIKDHRLDFFQ